MALPVSLLVAWLFARIFELPFKRHRSWKSLLAPVRSRTNGPARPGPAEAAPAGP